MSLREKINSLIDVLKNTDVNELEVTSFWGFQKIKLKKKPDTTLVSDAPVQPPTYVNEIETAKSQKINQEDVDIKQNLSESSIDTNNIESAPDSIKEDLSSHLKQKAPLVGTFYLSPKPGEPSFINIGDKVTKGQTLCIIEAMKIFNEIESDHDGTVSEILLEDGSPVEFDQVLFSINPD